MTRLSRLALALLALAGFAGPHEAPEPDRVVQTTGGRPSAVVSPVELHLAGALRLPVAALPAPAPLLAQRDEGGQRRYLRHRAWLL